MSAAAMSTTQDEPGIVNMFHAWVMIWPEASNCVTPLIFSV